MLDLLLPARTEKVLNKEAFSKFLEILEKIENVSAEVMTDDYKNELFILFTNFSHKEEKISFYNWSEVERKQADRRK